MLTSTSTMLPGLTTVEPVGVPVRITSPGSRVSSRAQVGDDVAEAEQHVLRGPGVLGQVPVDPGAEAERGQVHGAGVDQPRAQRGEAVDPLGPHVGAPVRVAQVVDAEVVRGGDPGHGDPSRLPGPRGRGRRPMTSATSRRGPAVPVGVPGNRIASSASEEEGLEKGRPGRLGAALGRATAVADVHRDDFAGNAFQGGHDAEIIFEQVPASPGLGTGRTPGQESQRTVVRRADGVR